MKILVCIRQGTDGEISPFDACAYEAALRIKGAQVTIVSMGPQSCKDFLLRMTRLGAKKAILLSDKAFAGADTLATAYTLSLAVKREKPDLIFCGRQTIVGDTAQTGPMLSELCGANLITNVMSIDLADENGITCTTRYLGVQTEKFPALLTIERICDLRLPSIMSRMGEVEVLSAKDLSADTSKTGLSGSPTRVLKTFENESGKRKCKFIDAKGLRDAINEGTKKSGEKLTALPVTDKKISKVFIVGQSPRDFANSISDDIGVIELTNADDITQKIKELCPNVVLWGSDALSKKLAAQVAAKLSIGLCADCTHLETDGQKLFMYRPALLGSVIAKIESLTLPAMATVRTVQEASPIVVAAGFGAKDMLCDVEKFAKALGADVAATRKAVDHDLLPYSLQVGLTGKTVCPDVYIALGVSGAVHHVAGMQRSGTVIAVNCDKDAPIFDYADYGIVGDIKEVLAAFFDI